MRYFINTFSISQIILNRRVRTLDPLAYVQDREVSKNPSDGNYHVIEVDSILSTLELESLFSQSETVEEQAIVTSYSDSASNFDNLPNWSTWSASEAEANITNSIFNGKTLAQVDADIDALPATIAGMRTGLHSAAAQIITIRNLLTFIAKAIVFLRDYIIKLRRV